MSNYQTKFFDIIKRIELTCRECQRTIIVNSIFDIDSELEEHIKWRHPEKLQYYLKMEDEQRKNNEYQNYTKII